MSTHLININDTETPRDGFQNYLHLLPLTLFPQGSTMTTPVAAPVNPIRKCYSLDDETYNFEGIGELIDNMTDPRVGSVYFEADCQDVTAEDYFNVGNILENADERLSEDVGDIADNDFSNVSKEAIAELKEALDAWATKYVALRYWKIVGKTRVCNLTEDDLA
jgi:hypothetical protein